MPAANCSVHGGVKIQDILIDLCQSPQKFISYICLLAQLYFKILNIEDVEEKIKEARRKLVCNLLFSMIEHCKIKFYYYPLRALAEFFMEGESEKALSKRLNAESLLKYKQTK